MKGERAVTRDKGLRRELSPEEVAEESKGIDETLPEAVTVHRRPLTERAKGASEHRAGEEEEAEDDPEREKVPKQEDPPKKFEQSEGAE
jgi:hypothetical protein